MGRTAAQVWQKGKQPTCGGEEEMGYEAVPRRFPPAPGTGAFRSLLNPCTTTSGRRKTKIDPFN